MAQYYSAASISQGCWFEKYTTLMVWLESLHHIIWIEIKLQRFRHKYLNENMNDMLFLLFIILIAHIVVSKIDENRVYEHWRVYLDLGRAGSLSLQLY